MASVAGAPYLPALTDLLRLEETLILEAGGLIDPVKNMENDNIYIFQGLLDMFLPWGKPITYLKMLL